METSFPHFFYSALCHPPAPTLLKIFTAIVINSWEPCIPTNPFLHCMIIFCSFCSLLVSPKFHIPGTDLAQRHYSLHNDEWFCLGEAVFTHYSGSAHFSL